MERKFVVIVGWLVRHSTSGLVAIANFHGTRDASRIPQTIEIIDAVYVIGPSENAGSFFYPRPAEPGRTDSPMHRRCSFLILPSSDPLRA